MPSPPLTHNSSSSLKVIQGGDKRATKTVQVVRLGVSAEANTVALIKWNWNNKQNGFTLIELLVVMVVMGIALGAVVLQLLPDERAILREEAQRLALLLENAGLEARASGRSLAWTVDKNNSGRSNTYRFWQKNEYSEWIKIEHDPAFRARALADGVQVAKVSIEDQPLPVGEYLVLSAHSFALPFQIQLQTARVTANVIGHSTGKVSIQLHDVQ